MVKPFIRHKGVLEYRHKTQICNRFNLKWQFIFQYFSEKVLVLLKLIIHILTGFVARTCVIRPVWVKFKYNNLIPYRYTLSLTSLKDRLYVLRDIIYYKDNPSHVIWILIDYHTQLTLTGNT